MAADVCKVLELGWDKTNKRYAPSRMVGYLDATEKGSKQIATSQGLQSSLLISESGLYKFVMRSNKPQAKPFQDWVTKDVLPSIRKTGSYVTGQPSLQENPQMDPLDLMMLRQQLLA